ncbi:uncharacterized protein LOC111634867 [Centruroides sculpturatus]|uniref:uncharacterized protein LOC111634867 n=1 Tax=Centruroides sculpturatus TaxID=218467 RepID=UPI000C6DFC78|nr:uncharacterized protein LOC111634867 [Centruroides sculpturatus]
MNVCILLVLGVIACNLGASNSFRMMRYLDAYCRLPERIRRITWNCIEDNLPSDERNTYKGMAQCFNEDSFVDVMNRMCGKTINEIIEMVSPHEDCLNNLNVADLGEPTVDLAVVVQCVRDKLD